MNQELANWTIERYLNESFIPSREDDWGNAVSTSKEYRVAVSSLDRFAGHSVTMGEVTEAILAEFGEWLIDNGSSAETAHSYCKRVRAIAREVNPTEFALLFNTRRAVDLLDKKEQENDARAGEVQQAGITLLTPIADARCLYHAVKQHRTNTRSRYNGAFNHWARLIGGEMVGSLTDANFAKYVEARQNEKAVADTIRGELNKILAFARWCVVRTTLPEPECKSPSRTRKAPKAWSKQEVRKLFDEARRTNRKVYGMPGSVFWPALLHTSWDTAERIGALLQLTRDDIDLHERFVRISHRKGGGRELVKKLSPESCKALGLLFRTMPGSDKVFMYGDPSTLWKAYGRILEDAGLPSGRDSKFHRLRKTHATWLHRAGGDATESLGHSSDEVTRASYIDPRYSQEKRADQLLFKPERTSIAAGLAGVLAWFGK
ncbi:tyrosine-type recombinase/integrase [Aeoliella mucimassa]|uniref:Site-specific tyrosine recombinase XerC n=1 Tax=Aeoliella mucimassa TaxID=2527972 RepID=A0A518AM22_9BACT|nr:site-specific integrase [Aeoliella mucimassa]QDU55775.1 site-specific tyrosine recombinase XerC [Aeoliella mucimassa]